MEQSGNQAQHHHHAGAGQVSKIYTFFAESNFQESVQIMKSISISLTKMQHTCTVCMMV